VSQNDDEKTIGHLLKKDSLDYASGRKFAYASSGVSYKKGRKKVSQEDLRKEVAVARILGEMSGAERVISSLVANPEWDRETLEAELHMFVVNCGDAAAELMQSENCIDLEEVLLTHGYYQKAKKELEDL
jgi:hypothetical protein